MKQRQSNMELLRIVSIIMVLAVHLDGASLGLPAPSGDISEVSARDWWCLAVECITIIGVNCFTLISGYFGIKASWRGLLKFSATCLFYSLGIYIGLIVTGLLQWSWSDFADSLMIFSHTDLWYVPAYLGVYILSPLLNAAAEGLGQKRFAWTLAAFVLFNLYCGWWWGRRVQRQWLYGSPLDDDVSYRQVYLSLWRRRGAMCREWTGMAVGICRGVGFYYNTGCVLRLDAHVCL